MEPKLVQKSKPELVPNICFSKGRTKVEQKLEPVLVPKLEPRFCFWSKKMNHENKKHKKKRCVVFFSFSGGLFVQHVLFIGRCFVDQHGSDCQVFRTTFCGKVVLSMCGFS